MIIYLTGSKELRLIMIFSSWEEILFRVRHSSVLGPMLFNIFLSDLFLVMKETEFISYVDDNTLYNAGNTIEDVISSLRGSSEKPFKSFSDNGYFQI